MKRSLRRLTIFLIRFRRRLFTRILELTGGMHRAEHILMIVAATFNAPIAGALFAVEVIIGDFGVAQFSPVVIASVVATICSRHYLGDFPAFQVPEYELISSFEFIPFTILGIAAGLLAVLFIKLLYATQTIFETVDIPHIVKPAIGGFIVGGVAIFFPQVYGFGYESINQALWGDSVQSILLLIIAAKMLATSFTLGSGGSGGIFAPSLFCWLPG